MESDFPGMEKSRVTVGMEYFFNTKMYGIGTSQISSQDNRNLRDS